LLPANDETNGAPDGVDLRASARDGCCRRGTRLLPPVAGGEAADDETQQGVREGGGFGGRRNQKQGREGEEEEHGAEPKVPTPDGKEEGREFSSLDLPVDSFSVLVLGQNPNGLVNSPPFFMSILPAQQTLACQDYLPHHRASIQFRSSKGPFKIEIVCYKGKQQKIPLELKKEASV